MQAADKALSTFDFDIRRSSKTNIESPEQFMVTLNGAVYLRILGQEGEYRVMTATASEDWGDFSVFGDQNLMHEAAIQISRELGLDPFLKTDVINRPYVEICTCEFLSDAYRASELFFRILRSRGDDLRVVGS